MDLPNCEGCRRLQAELDQARAELAQTRAELGQARAEITELRQQLHDLQQRLKLDSSNSSIPPSANPLHGRKLPKKEKTNRKAGGQPGHQPCLRQRMPPEKVSNTITYVPPQCEWCDAPLPEEPGPNDPEPTWHQYVELPPVAAIVTEYQGHARTCSNCGEVTRASIPAEITAHMFGPYMTATVAFFTGRLHVSRRKTEEAVETLFGAPIALGTISNLEQEVSEALAPAQAEAGQAVADADVKNLDETSWKQAGEKRWLWVAATTQVACFLVCLRRNTAAMLDLLGDKIKGVLISDRWSVYARWPTNMRQLCWAHLKRDFQKLVDRGGASLKFGEKGLATVRILFHEWHLFRGGGSRAKLQHTLEPQRQAVREWLEEGTRCGDRKTATFCQNLLDLEPALWTFLYIEGVEPTNNHAERVLRTGVLWRKNSFGCHSEAGCRFVSRILTVVQTLRLQQRPVFAYLAAAVAARRAGTTAPSLLCR